MEVVVDFNGKILEERLNHSVRIEPNNHAVYLDVKQYLANQRQRNAKAKERAEVAEVHVRLKKELVLLVRVVQRTVCGGTVLDQDQEVIHLN
jgi:LEA14-like dessication related protein